MAPHEPVVERSPWISIWIYPRKTIRSIVESGRPYGVIPLAAVWGISITLTLASVFSVGDRMPMGRVFALGALSGLPIGIGLLYLNGGIFAFLGRIFGGKGDASEVRVVMAWSTLPIVLGLARWPAWIAILGGSVFTSGTARGTVPIPQSIVLAEMSLIGSALGVWSFAIWLLGYAEINEFSIARGMASLLVGGAIVGLAAVVLFGICAPLVLFALTVAWMLIGSSLGAS